MKQIQVILRDDVPNLGDAGELVRVRPGYARNYLLPQGKATLATAGNLRELEHHKRVIEEKLAREQKQLEAERKRIEAVSVEIAAQVGDEGKLFGSVSAAQIAEKLAEQGVVVDRRKVQLAEPIKEAGEHEVTVRLLRDFVATVKVKVVAAT